MLLVQVMKSNPTIHIHPTEETLTHSVIIQFSKPCDFVPVKSYPAHNLTVFFRPATPDHDIVSVVLGKIYFGNGGVDGMG